jgi:hypothetical protein
MDRVILDWFVYTQLLTLLVPLALLLLGFNRQPKVYLWLVISLLFSLMCDIAGRILILFSTSPNFSNTVYWLFSIIPITTFFYYAIKWRSLQAYLIVINIAYLLFGVVNYLYIQAESVNSYSNILHSLIILVLCIVYFYKLLKDLPAQQLQRLPMFWIVSAFFFSHAGKLVIYTVTHYLIHFVRDNLIIVWSFHNFLSIIANLLIAYGAWLNHKQLRSTSLSL